MWESLVQDFFTPVAQQHLAHVSLVHRKWKGAGDQDAEEVIIQMI